MQLRQGDNREARITELHACAESDIEHPGGHDNDHTGRHLDVDDLTVGPLLAVLPLQSATVERVPTVVDLDFLPDMRRMTWRLPLVAATGSSLEASWRGSGPRW